MTMSDSDVKRDVDRILRAVHGAPKQKPATAKFDKEKFLRALNASLVEQFPRLTAPGQSALYIYRGELPLQRIARGMAAASKRAAVVIQLQSEDLDLRRGDGKQLLDPLLTGQTVILVHERSLPIGARLAAYWPKFVMNPTAYRRAADGARDARFSTLDREARLSGGSATRIHAHVQPRHHGMASRRRGCGVARGTR
jgi:hypothetical protein